MHTNNLMHMTFRGNDNGLTNYNYRSAQGNRVVLDMSQVDLFNSSFVLSLQFFLKNGCDDNYKEQLLLFCIIMLATFIVLYMLYLLKGIIIDDQ